MRKFFAGMPPGIRLLVWVTLFSCGLGLLLRTLGILDTRVWLSLHPADFRAGRYWEVVTFPLAPVGVINLLFNCVALIVLGTKIEQAWSRREFWSFCLICSVSAGVAKLLLTPHASMPLAGMGAILVGLLGAWLKLFGSEEILLLGQWKMSVRNSILLALAISLLCALGTGLNLLDLTVQLSGGIGAWIYLSLRWRRNFSMPTRTVSSERFGRLEM